MWFKTICDIVVLALQLDRFIGFCLPYFDQEAIVYCFFCPSQKKKKIYKLQDKGIE